MYSKRDYAIMFAREDCRRFNEGEDSVSKTIVTAAEENDQLTDFAETIKKKQPKSGITAPLRTTEAWLRRAAPSTITVLGIAARALLLPCGEDMINVHDLSQPPVNEIVLAGENDEMDDNIDVTTPLEEKAVANDSQRCDNAIMIIEGSINDNTPRGPTERCVKT